MEVLDQVKTLQALCKALGKYGVHIFISEMGDVSTGWSEILKAAPYLELGKHGQLLCDRQGFLLFDSLKEMEEVFWQTVGDDGPTPANPYNGPARVYAITCSPEGELMNENT